MSDTTWRIGSTAETLYRNRCRMFATNDQAFKAFKRERLYSGIIGNDNASHTAKCLAKIKEFPEVLKKMDEFTKNDAVGEDPYMLSLEGQKISMNTVRSAHSVCLLQESFGDLNGKTVLEIGAGWGGTASCVKMMWPECKFSIIDLPEACMLQEKYLKLLGVNNVTFNPSEVKPQLVIAEYSISEHKDPTIVQYWQSYLKNADGIFLRWNTFNEGRDNMWFTKFREEFDLTVEIEDLTRIHNKIVIGKR